MDDAVEQMFNDATKNMVDKIMNYNDKSLMQWVIDYVPIEGYMFNNSPQLRIISDLVEEDGHSEQVLLVAYTTQENKLLH